LIVGIAAAVAAVIAVGIWQFYSSRDSIEPASIEKMAYDLPKKPSIVVLPFDNLSKDTEADFFVDAISENIIATLAKSPQLFVIARNSAFAYKGKTVKIAQVSEELGVNYVMEGSVLKSGDHIRITAQLIDALKGDHIWAETYDREFKDVLAVMDEITLEIAKALSIELLSDSMLGAEHKTHTKSLEAWTLYTEAIHYFDRTTEEGNVKSKEILERVIELDPNFSMAWAYLAWTRALGVRYGWSPFKTESSFQEATKLVQKSIGLDDSNSLAYACLGDINLFQGNYDKARTLR
jgi:adenylate cyclase